MQSDVVLTAAHWIYLISVAAIILTMILRANVVVPSVIGTFLVVLAITGNPISGLIGIFSASFVAAKELFNIFLVITFMTALLNSLKTLQADVRMVQPFRRVMRGGHSSFVIIALCTYVISLFFWPTPAVPLVSAILLPAAIAAGLPPLAGAMAIAIAGQGMALSSDYVIGVAPSISWAAFDLGSVRARLRGAEADADGALASYEQQVLLALEESENAFSDYARAQERLLSLLRQSTASRAAAQQAEIRYREGTVDFLVLLDAERERLAAEDAQAQAEVELYRGVVALYKALGGGWQAES